MTRLAKSRITRTRGELRSVALAAALLVGASCASFAQVAGSAEAKSATAGSNMGNVVSNLPVADNLAAARVYQRLLKSGPAGVRQLVAMLVEPGKGDDAKARMALHGLAFYVSRAGAEKDRKMFCNTLADCLTGDRPASIKRFLVSQLRLAGDEEAVDALGKLLPGDDLGKDSVRALVTIGGDRSAQVLRQSLEKAKASARVPIIQALGQLRDGQSVLVLLRLVRDDDRNVRLASLSALGKIGDPSATKTLLEATGAAGSAYERGKVTEACFRLAQGLTAAGKKKQAEGVYRHFWMTDATDQDAHIRSAALHGLVETLGLGAMNDLLTALKSRSVEIRAAAVQAGVSLRDENTTELLIGHLKQASPMARAGIVRILGRRGNHRALSHVLAAVKDKDEGVRLAAIESAATLAKEEAISVLVAVFANSSAIEQEAAALALARLAGKPVIEAAAAALPKASASGKAHLLGILTRRRVRGHMKLILSHAASENEAVRIAAIVAAGQADPESAPLVVDLLAKSKTYRERTAAQKAVVAVCRRITNQEKQCEPVLAAWARADSQTRRSLLRILRRMAGTKALAAVIAATEDADATVQDEAVHMLSRWPDAAPMEKLSAIARDTEKELHHVLALRGYVRMVGLRGDLRIDQRLQLYKNALAIARRDEEKMLIKAAVATMLK